MASRSSTWYDMNGRSATTSGCVEPRAEARVSISISSIVTGTVDGCPSTVMAAESPTSTSSTPASLATLPDG